MNIGIIWENIEVGGVGTHLEILLNNKKFKNCKFTIFTNKNNIAYARIKNRLNLKNTSFVLYKSLNVFIFRNKILQSFYFLFQPILFLISIFQFYKLLKKFEFDILLGNCGGYGSFRSEMAAIIAAHFLRFSNKILLIHHSFTRPILWNNLLKTTNYILRNFVDSFIFVSNAVKNDIKKNTCLLNNSKKISIIHNGIDIKDFSKNNKQLNKVFKKGKGTLKIGMISRVEEYKGHMDLINCYHELPSQIKNKISIYFIGKSSKKFKDKILEKIKKFNLKRIYFTGFLNYESSAIAKQLDLLVSLTKDFEGFGLTLAEALSVKTPVLSTKVGGVIEFLNKKNSTLIDANNKKALDFAIKDFVNNEKKWKKKALIGKREIHKHFNSNIMAKNYYIHFNKFVNNKI